MKIVTVNIPEAYLEAINRFLDNKEHDNNGMYPSRSELIRVAVRDFLIKELKRAEEHLVFEKEVKPEELPEGYVRVPQERIGEDGEPVREFKTYKIIKRLEY